MNQDRDTSRLLKQAERDRRMNGIYRTYPALKTMDEALAAAGMEGLLAACEGGSVEAARQKIARLCAEKEQLLREINLDEQIYDVAWDCPLCQDRGYIRPGEICGCRRKDEGFQRVTESGLSPLQKKQSFENFSLQWYDRPVETERVLEECKRFARDIVEGRPCGNLFLYGSVGSGKTHLCSAVANQILAAGKTVIYTRTEAFLEALREDIYGRGDFAGRRDWRNRDDQAEESDAPARAPFEKGNIRSRLIRADLLILEDLGTELWSEFAEEHLTNLVDQRTNWQKPWIVTSNLVGEKFTGRYGKRLVERILSEGKRLHLNENSVRIKMARKAGD